MDSKLTRWCDGVLEAGWLAAIVITPLFFNIHSSRVFEPDKLTLLRSVALMMSVVWLVKFVEQQGWQSLHWLGWRGNRSVWRVPFVLPVGLLVVVYLLSTLFSVTPQVSWAGSYQRLQGTYTTLSYIVIFALMASTIRTRQQMGRVVTTVIICTVPVSLYAMLQKRGLDPLPWGGDTQRRVAGHMGNAIFIAAYLIMALPLTASRIIHAFTNILNDEEMSWADIVRSAIYIFTLAVQLIAIYYSGSRGPWLGLGIGMFAFVLIVLVSLRNATTDRSPFRGVEGLKALGLVVAGTFLSFLILNSLVNLIQLEALAGAIGSFAAFVGAVGLTILAIFVMVAARRGWRWLWLSWLGISVLVGLWLVAFNLVDQFTVYQDRPIIGGMVETLTAWREVPAIGRLGRILESESGTGKVRVLIWEGALQLILPHGPLEFPDGQQDPFNFLRPLLGYGPESMYVAYNRFYPPELATVEARNASPDRSHNETFDAFVITGAGGFLVWQALYLSVFYFSFSWLGVVRTRRDQILLVGLWIGGAVVGGVLLTAWLGAPFFGVAVPFGSIIGLVIYLVYYALVARVSADERSNPFQLDRLLLIGLLTAVVAHYVEIHFGIAIAATRTHFFAFLALILTIGYRLPQVQAEMTATKGVTEGGATGGGKRGKRGKDTGSAGTPDHRQGWSAPVMAAAGVLTLIIGVLAFNYTTFSLPRGQTIQTIEDVPSVGEIFHQSFFVHPGQNYVESPFIFLMIVMSWGLGALIFLSEMHKEGVFRQEAKQREVASGRARASAGIFVLWLVVGVILPLTSTATSPLNTGLQLLWSLVNGGVALLLLLGREGRRWAGIVALVGLSLSLPLLAAGAALQGLGFLISYTVVLYLLWDSTWQQSFMPALILTSSSFLVGMLYALYHASLVRQTIFAPTGVTQETPEVVRRVLEAGQSTGYLTWFYIFLFLLLFIMGVMVNWSGWFQAKETGKMPALIALPILLTLGFAGTYISNMRIIHADMVYKRGDPWDKQAARTADPAIWDIAIAIYNQAIELAPREDFYYLFIGRAYLEKASLDNLDATERETLLQTASSRLQEAQRINPLNTDHTANLARLNTRWADIVSGAERDQRVQDAIQYYEAAIRLSPQNAVIRNERAKLAFVFGRNCEQSIALYNESARTDPYYANSRFERGEVQLFCGNEAQAEEQIAYYQQSVASFQEGLEINDSDPRRWTVLAQVYEKLEDYEQALASYEEARTRANSTFPAWRTSFLMANAAEKMGDIPLAISYAQESLEGAPAEQAPEIQAYLSGLTGEPAPESATPPPAITEIADGNFTPLSGDRPLAAIEPAARNNFYSSFPPMIIDTAKTYDAVIITAKGTIRLRLFDDLAPQTVNNFVYLATQGFYDGVTFHRVMADFMAQAGDPTGTGTGGPGYIFADETSNGLKFDRTGLLAMANRGANTNGSQFFITFVPTPHLDGLHTIFGEVVEGEEVLNAISLRDPSTGAGLPPGDLIERIEVFVAEG